MLWLSYAILNSVRKRGSASSTGSCSRNDDTAGAVRHTSSSSLPSMTGACAARVATTVLVLSALALSAAGGADRCAWTGSIPATAELMTSHAHVTAKGPSLATVRSSNDRTSLW